jgi:hypothetical protein
MSFIFGYLPLYFHKLLSLKYQLIEKPKHDTDNQDKLIRYSINRESSISFYFCINLFIIHGTNKGRYSWLALVAGIAIKESR